MAEQSRRLADHVHQMAGLGWAAEGAAVGLNADRRGVQLELTPDGRVAYRQAVRAVTHELDDVLGFLEPEEQADARRGLELLGTALRARGLQRLGEAAPTGTGS